jgi:hypothetical protein
VLLGEKNLSHLRRLEFLWMGSQRSRAGLICAAPPALLRRDFGKDSVFLASASEGKPKRPLLSRRAGPAEASGAPRARLKDQRYMEDCGGAKVHRPFGPGGARGARKVRFAQDRQECLCHRGGGRFCFPFGHPSGQWPGLTRTAAYTSTTSRSKPGFFLRAVSARRRRLV